MTVDGADARGVAIKEEGFAAFLDGVSRVFFHTAKKARARRAIDLGNAFGLFRGFVDQDGLGDDDGFQGFVAAIFRTAGDFIDDVHAFKDFAKGGILAIQEQIVGVADEELAAGGIRMHAAGHGNDAAFMAEGIIESIAAEFAFDGIARSTGADAIGVAALDHEALDDAVERQAIIKAFRDEICEVFRGVGGGFVIELDFDVAQVFNRENNHVFFSFPG